MKNPKLIVKPFAKNGQKNVIPENYETSMESNQATWDQGFGQITMLPVAAGGLPPKGQDFNGIFNQLSENIVYLSQGGRFKFSAEYAESIGGYPKGAILQSDDEKKEYLSLIDNNKVNFNVAPDISASWEVIGGSYATKAELANGLNKKVNTSDVSQTLGNGLTKLPSLDLVTRELGKKASTADVNGKLAKDQNGADIPDKPKFIENLGLKEVFQPKGNYAPTGNYAYKGDSYTKAESDNNYQPKGSYQVAGYSYSKTESDNAYQPKGNYQAAGYGYSKAESDQRYIVTGNQGVSNVVSGVNLNDGESANLNQDCRGKVMWVYGNESNTGGCMTIIPYDGYPVTTHHGAQGRLTLTLANNGRTIKVIYTQSGTRLTKIDIWS